MASTPFAPSNSALIPRENTSMRARLVLWCAVWALLAAGSVMQPVGAQEVALATKRPRFLYASRVGATPGEIDAERHATLRRVVSLRIEEPTVGRLLAEIERQTGLVFGYSHWLRTDKPLNLRADSIPVASA